MENLQYLSDNIYTFLPLLIILAIWDGIWKLIAMWKAGRNNHLAWFIIIALINSVGILPIIYILIQRKKGEKEE